MKFKIFLYVLYNFNVIGKKLEKFSHKNLKRKSVSVKQMTTENNVKTK